MPAVCLRVVFFKTYLIFSNETILYYFFTTGNDTGHNGTAFGSSFIVHILIIFFLNLVGLVCSVSGLCRLDNMTNHSSRI